MVESPVSAAVLHRPDASDEISMELSRSWLLVAARGDSLPRAAVEAGADQIVLDIEDAIDPIDKDAARARTLRWLAEDAPSWVRINSRDSDHWDADVDALAHAPGLRGVVLAKTESAAHVTDTFRRLGCSTPVIALIESARGIEDAVAIAQAEGVVRLAFGSGDYRRDTGAAATDLAMAYPRSRLVVASRIGELPGPIDGPTVDRSSDVLREQTAVSSSLGMTGKLCLYPSQPVTVDAVLSPSADDVRWSREFLDDFSANGGVVRDGSDLPRLHHARRIARLARVYDTR